MLKFAINGTGFKSIFCQVIKLSLSGHRISFMKTIAFYVSAILLMVSGCSDSRTTQRGVTINFYDIVRKYSIYGVPDDTTLVKLEPYISTRLQTLLQSALSKEKLLQKMSNEPEPPRFENCLFTSAFEGFSIVKDVKSDSSCNNCMLITFLLDAPAPSLQPITWTDRIYLQKERGQWVIDDIEYLFNCQFCPTSRLRLTLEAFIRE